MCKKCELKPVYEFTNKRKLCARCFVRYFQKKFFYIIRKFGMIKSDDIVGYENRGDFRGVVLEDSLKIFSKKAGIGIVKLPAYLRSQIDKKISKTAISSTLDLEANEVIRTLIKERISELKKINPIIGKIIKPLYLFLDREVLLYAKIRKLNFKNKKIKKTKISNFIDELEKKHPEVKRAVVNSYLKMLGGRD